MKEQAEQIQKQYYAQTAAKYDGAHIHEEGDGNHNFSLFFLSSVIKLVGVKSILDVGSGTGRVITFLRENHPEVKVVGIEPVKELREQGYKKGIAEDALIEGDGNHLDFENESFDLVCEFGMLHHVPYPERVVAEMLRVSKKAIFISDSNNFGQGSGISRVIKQTLNFFGLWGFYNYCRTGGKRYQVSEGDGLFYSYSLFNNYHQIKRSCKRIHLLNTTDGAIDFYRTASHVALVGIKN